MDGKLLARIGAAVFAGFAVAITLVQLRAEPQGRADPEAAVWMPDGDPLPAQLRICSRMGELALSSADCRAAWAEKRRRFFGADYPGAYSGMATDPTPTESGGPASNRPGEN